MTKDLEFIQGKLQELLAVEQLQYHNKNWLVDPKQTSEMKQDEMQWLINKLGRMIEEEKVEAKTAPESSAPPFYPGPITNIRQG